MDMGGGERGGGAAKAEKREAKREREAEKTD